MSIWQKATITVVVLILVIVGLLWGAIVIVNRTDMQDFQNGSIDTVILSNIRSPLKDFRYYLREEFLIDKNEWHDLEPISEEEWGEVVCKYNGKSNASEITYKVHYDGVNNSLNEAEKRRYYCLSPDVAITKYEDLPKNNKDYLYREGFGTGELIAPCHKINFHEYILQYPKILRNILKIAERPCDYIKNLKEEASLSSNLLCNSFGKWPYRNERTCVVINVIGSEGELRNQIIVPRKDNTNLFNK